MSSKGYKYSNATIGDHTRRNAEIRTNMNGAKPERSGRGDDCREPFPRSVGAKKGLGLRLSLSRPRRSQSQSDDCSEPSSQSQGKFNLLANL